VARREKTVSVNRDFGRFKQDESAQVIIVADTTMLPLGGASLGRGGTRSVVLLSESNGRDARRGLTW